MRSHDLHTHSTVSDGSLSPTALVAAAVEAGIGVLALTDHDCTDGIAEARTAGAALGLTVIAGVEISATWQNKTVHIVGLNIDPDSPALRTGLLGLQAQRGERAEEIGRRLVKHGITGVYEAARELAGAGMITRTHFARQLYQAGLATSARDAFDRYLAHDKPGYISTRWAGMDEAIDWIRQAGGTAVIAHPHRYKLTGSWLRRLLGEFRAAGGGGLEVVSGTAAPGEVQSSTAHAQRLGLLASCGSDFHGPEYVWPKLGRLPPLPPGLVPVWSEWSVADG